MFEVKGNQTKPQHEKVTQMYITWERFDISKLQSEEIRRWHDIEVRNRFETLRDN